MKQNMKKKTPFLFYFSFHPFQLSAIHALPLNKSFGYQDTGNARLKTFLKGLGFLSYARVETMRREPHCEFKLTLFEINKLYLVSVELHPSDRLWF